MFSETGIDDCSVSPAPPHRPLEYDGITAQLRFLSGKILTIVDASFADTEQRKAVKDLVRNAFQQQHEYNNRLCFGFGDGSPASGNDDWWVYSTAIAEKTILVENRTTKQRASVCDPTPEEWKAAFHAPSEPYRWLHPERLIIDPTT